MLNETFSMVSDTVFNTIAADITSRCTESYINFPHIPGTQVLGVSAQALQNHTLTTATVPELVPFNLTVDICNVTINYGHRAWGDNVQVNVWLPLRTWNGRLSGIGGSGFASLMSTNDLAPAVSLGYAAVGTDAGHEMNFLDASSWALGNSSQVNFFLLQNNFAISQNEAAIIAKEVIRGVYGKSPDYSYWNGCSTGGRQGLMLAQRYPDAYDGILAAAPAINWASFVPGMYFPQFVMNQANHYPEMCVFSAAHAAALTSCDELDGVKDGIMSSPQECNFDVSTLIGQQIDCQGRNAFVTGKDIQVIQRIWDGPRYADGTPIWYAMRKDVSFSDLANTTCEEDRCRGAPFGIAACWIQSFLLQNSTADLTTLSGADWEGVMGLSISAYKSVTSTDSPDLTDFQRMGGKLLHWHGVADQEIFVQGSEDYYRRVESRHPKVRDFYRYFEAPGVGNCGGGYGLSPQDPLSALVDWVEHGTAPDHLPAATPDNKQWRNLCPYPLVPSYTSGDPAEASSFECRESFV